MWILENWQLCGSSPVAVKRAFRKAFKLETHQLPKCDQTFKDEYNRMKKNKSVGHLEPGPKVRPDRFKLIPECQDEEKVERVREHARSCDRGMSLKDRSIELDMPMSSIQVILRHNIGMKAWKIMEVQDLDPKHFPARKTFCQFLKQQPAGFEHKG